MCQTVIDCLSFSHNPPLFLHDLQFVTQTIIIQVVIFYVVPEFLFGRKFLQNFPYHCQDGNIYSLSKECRNSYLDQANKGSLRSSPICSLLTYLNKNKHIPYVSTPALQSLEFRPCISQFEYPLIDSIVHFGKTFV